MYVCHGSGLEGLQLRENASGEWVAVNRELWPEGALMLNVGDSLHRLSNGRLRSTPHRVMSSRPKGVSHAPIQPAIQPASQDRRRLSNLATSVQRSRPSFKVTAHLSVVRYHVFFDGARVT
jgi:hypothetical protein